MLSTWIMPTLDHRSLHERDTNSHSTNQIGGIAFKYPVSVTNRILDFLVKDIQGENVAPIDYQMYR